MRLINLQKTSYLVLVCIMLCGFNNGMFVMPELHKIDCLPVIKQVRKWKHTDRKLEAARLT